MLRKFIPASTDFQLLKESSQFTYVAMKTIFIFISVFSLGILTLLAEKTSQHKEIGDPGNNPSKTYRGALLKRGVSKRTSGHWRKANSSPVCFGAKYTQFGRFYTPKRGKLGAIKLVHLYGYVACNNRRASHWSYWGCNQGNGDVRNINVVITTAHNHVLLPPNQFTIDARAKWSRIPGYDSLSPELFLSVISHPVSVRSGQQLRLWYGEDLMNMWEGDNGGRACCDVYALYV